MTQRVSVVLLISLCSRTSSDHCDVTPEDTDNDILGPYFIKDVPYKGYRTCPEQKAEGEERLAVSGYIMDTTCKHVPCAEIEIWSTDANGGYSFLEPYWGRGRIRADMNGFFEFKTWYPEYYPDGIFPFPIPRHVHFLVTPIDQSSFSTQMYFHGDERSDSKQATQKITPQRAANGIDWEANFSIVLNLMALPATGPNALVQPDSCPSDTGLSTTNQKTMTQAQKDTANELQGSELGLDEAVIVTDFPSKPSAPASTTTPTATVIAAPTTTVIAATTTTVDIDVGTASGRTCFLTRLSLVGCTFALSAMS